MTVSRASLRGPFLLTAILMMSYGAIFSLLGQIRDSYGFSETGIGLIAGIAFLTGFLAQLLIGKSVDAGQGPQVLKGGVLLALAGAVWMVFAESLLSWICARGLFGLGSGFIRPALRRLVLMSEPEQVGRNMGRLSAYEMGGFLLGPVVASLLVTWFSMQVTFIVMSVLLLLVVPVAFRTAVPGSVPADRLIGIHGRLLAKREMRACLAMAVAFYTTVGVFEAIWAVFLLDLGASQLFIGFSMSLFAIPMVFIAPWAGSLAYRLGPFNVTLVTVSVAMVCMVSYGLLESIYLLCIPLAIHAIADAFTMPANQLAVGQASGSDGLATGQGLFGAVGMAVSALVAMMSGYLYQHFGAPSLWIGSALVMAVCLLFACWQGDNLRKPRSVGEPLWKHP